MSDRAPMPPPDDEQWTGLRPPEPPLADGHIALRPWRDEDVDAVVAACQDPVIQRFVPVPVPYTPEVGRGFVEASHRGWAQGSEGRFAIADANDDSVLGALGLHPVRYRRWDVGYWIAPWARRRGVATAAVRMVCEWAMREHDLVRIGLFTDVDNEASQRTALAAGFRREGTLRNWTFHHDTIMDAVMFSLVPEDLGQGIDRDGAVG
jgi:RimJ/RimL family protein N-acetyltransferase